MLRVPEQSVPVVSSSLPWAERAWCRQLPPVLQQGLALPMAGSSLVEKLFSPCFAARTGTVCVEQLCIKAIALMRPEPLS